jgi:putative ATPase
MQCLPDNLRDRQYFHPTDEGFEREIRKRMEDLVRVREAAKQRESANKDSPKSK